MPVRGIAVDFPSWWLAALASLMAPQPDGSPGVTKTQLAEALIPKTATGPARVRALNAARVKVSRFFDDKEPSRTVEIADAWCAEFGLPRFRYEATSRKMALAMQIVASDPDIVERVIAARTLMMSLESGEHRLDELLSRHSGDVGSPHGVVGRGSRSREPGSKAARSERR